MNDDIDLSEFEDEPEHLIRKKASESSRDLLALSSSGRLTIPKNQWEQFLVNWDEEKAVYYTVKFNKKEQGLAVVFHKEFNRPIKCRKVQRYTGRSSKEPTTAYIELAPSLRNWGYKIKHNELFYVDYIFSDGLYILLLDLKGHIEKI